MSDVTAKCAKCGKERLVSEFVDSASLVCPDCGTALEVDTTGASRTRALPRILGLKPKEQVEQEAAAAAKRRPKFRPKHGSLLARVGSQGISDLAISWILLCLLAPTLTYLRWGDILSPDTLKSYITCGLIVFGVFYLVVVVEAFSQEVFDGMLALFLPPFTVWYLFAKSDSFSLRAIIVSLGIAFGYDIVTVVGGEMVTLFIAINNWIQGGWEK